MNIIDLLIIYLTCGAPFGVYYFCQQSDSSKSPKLWIKSLLVTLFWFPYAVKLLQTVFTKRLLNTQFAQNKNSDSFIDSFEKKFSQILWEENAEVSLFDFREIFERYVGLTKAISDESEEFEAELYEITNHENKKLAAILLNRRNRLRLEAHQIAARNDFLQMIERIYFGISEKEKVRNLTVDFVKLINDDEALKRLHEFFENSTQSIHNFTVKEMEKEIWNPIEPKQLPTHPKALSFRTLPATATTSKHD